MDLGLHGKTAIVTGGASGIGAGISKVLAGEGTNLVIADRDCNDNVYMCAEEMKRGYKVSVDVYKCDVSKENEINNFYKNLDEKNIVADILVNNAAGGAPQGKGIDEITYDEWQRAMDGCLLPVFLMSKPFIVRCLAKSKKGNIINISAKAAFRSSSHNKIPYATAKGAVATMTMRMANDYIEKGINVNSLVPGYVLSGFYKGTKKELDDIAMQKGLRIGWASPEDMGNIVAFLCSDKSRQIIGANIDCSGGTML